MHVLITHLLIILSFFEPAEQSLLSPEGLIENPCSTISYLVVVNESM